MVVDNLIISSVKALNVYFVEILILTPLPASTSCIFHVSVLFLSLLL